MALLENLAQGDKAFFDTLLTKAEGDQFDRLCVMYGVLRPRSLSSVAAWRQAARAAVFGKRDARGTIYQVLRHGLKAYDTAFTVRGDLTVANRKSRIYWVAGGGVAGFEPADVFRLWEIGGKVYWARNGDGAWAGGVSTYLEMSPWVGHSWTGLDWSAAGSPVPPGGTLDMAAKLLPFTWWAAGAKVEVFADAQATVPSTYLQEQFQFAFDGKSWGGFFSQSFTVQDTGVLEKLRLTDGPEGVVFARGGNYLATVYKNGVDTALTVTLGPADKTAENAAGTLAVVAGDVITIAFLLQAGTTAMLDHPSASVFVQKPAGQPLGGYLQPDASSDDPTQGPWPPYLNAEYDSEFTDVLSRLVAAGVVVDVKRRTTPGVA